MILLTINLMVGVSKDTREFIRASPRHTKRKESSRGEVWTVLNRMTLNTANRPSAIPSSTFTWLRRIQTIKIIVDVAMYVNRYSFVPRFLG